MKINMLLVFVLFALVTFSQEKGRAARPAFRLISSGGVSIGEKGVGSVFQAIPGIYYKNYSAGIGVGLDDYRFRSLPLFIDIRYNFCRKEFGFLYADGGYNLSAGRPDIETAGFYGDFGLGCRIFKKRKHAFLFSAGYSIKNIKRTIKNPYQPFLPPAEEDVSHYRYSMGRIISKLSWEFGRAR